MSPGLVFISHASADTDSVIAMARSLRQAGVDVWLDVERLTPGDPWMSKLEWALREAQSLILYVGPSGVRNWVDLELRVALDRSARESEFRLVPVLGPGAQPDELPLFLKQYQWLDCREGFASPEHIKVLIAALAGEQPAAICLLPPGQSPYRGLRPFGTEDSLLFYGRDKEVEELARNVGKDRFLAVVGDSGSGKSSLVRAGLIPALHRGRVADVNAWIESWRVAICRPGDDPFRELAEALPQLDSELSPAERTAFIAQMKDQLVGGTVGLRNGLSGIALGTGIHKLLVIDQFEELFTLVRDKEERTRYINTLLAAVPTETDHPVHILITIRADFYSQCWQHSDLIRRINANQYAVPRMDRDQLRQVIERPLALAGAHAEPGLVDALLSDAGNEPGTLPLLEHALEQLWKRRTGRQLTTVTYEDIGRLNGALRKYADAVYQRLRHDDERELARKMFLRLTQLGEGAEDTRRRVRKAELLALNCGQADATHVLDSMVSARLITAGSLQQPPHVLDTHKPPVDVNNDQFVEVTHEALIRGWPLLQTWVNDSRDVLRIERRILQAAAEWVSFERDPASLWQGARLAEAEEWAGHHGGDLPRDAKEFLAASIYTRNDALRLETERHEAEAARKRREKQLRTTRLTAVVLAMSCVLAGWLALVARRESGRASVNFALAKSAVDELLSSADRGSANAAFDVPEVAELRRDLLERARGFYAELIQQEPASEELRSNVARAHLGLGHIYRLLGNSDEAVKAYEEAVAKFENLVVTFPAEPEYQAALGGSYDWLGEMLRPLEKRFADAHRAYSSAVALQRSLVSESPQVSKNREDLARTLYHRGILSGSRATSSDSSHFAEAEADFRESIRLLEPLANTNLKAAQELARAQNNLAAILAIEPSRLSEARELYLRAIRIGEKVTTRAPSSREAKLELVKFYINLAVVLSEQSDSNGARRETKRALNIIAKLRRPPPSLGIDEADAYSVLGHILAIEGLLVDAVNEYRHSLEMFHTLAEDPETRFHPQFLLRFSDLLNNVAVLRRQREDDDSVRALLVRILDSHIELVRRYLASGSLINATTVLQRLERALAQLSSKDRQNLRTYVKELQDLRRQTEKPQ